MNTPTLIYPADVVAQAAAWIPYLDAVGRNTDPEDLADTMEEKIDSGLRRRVLTPESYALLREVYALA